MKEKLRDLLFDETFSAYKDKINKENRKGIHLLAVAGIPVSAANFVAQLVVIGSDISVMRASWMLLYFFLLLVADSFFIPEELPHAVRWLYAIETPPMLLSVILGSFWDPTHSATTILLFVIVMPVFLMDRPWRVFAVMSFWTVVFCALSWMAKDPYMFRVDTIHVIEFLIASSAVSNTVQLIRLRFLKNLQLAEYNLSHDPQTQCLSRYALASGTKRYLKKVIIVMLADIDRLRLYRDMYGHIVADDIVKFTAKAVRETFGEENTYRYGGDEILCVLDARKMPLDECLKRLEACREALRGYNYEGKSITLTFALGYATGVPDTDQEFRAMIQLADIFTHRARRIGLNQTSGGIFDKHNLKQGIIDSALYESAEIHETDSLTRLPNMSFFIARADEILNSIADESRVSVIGHIKIMQIRSFNNRYGYEKGDRLIADTAAILKEAFDKRMLSHITAGQYCVLCYEDEAEDMLRNAADKLAHYRSDYVVEIKAGFARFTGRETAISLLDRAKLALKSISKNRHEVIRFFDAALEEEIGFGRYIIDHVDEAVEKGWLQVYYQPIARAVTGEVCEEEALSRWVDPVYGFLAPYRFIPVLEETGLMYKVNLHVVRTVLRDFKRRKQYGIPVVPVSVNLSRKDFEQCDMAEEITRLVDDAGFSHDMIKIEITESAFISNQEMLSYEVGRFRSNGFDVWMDDFGSEYSTLNLLQELDFDLIKIDMKFMKNFIPGEKNYIIVSHIIEMARDMGITTLIEGVETWEQYRIVKRLGCEKIQGYLFNKPNPFDYIKERAKSGTGLTFESPETKAYYAAIGAVNLNEPKALNFGDSGISMTNEVPEGILELRGGRLYLLRGNDSFLQQMEAWGYFHTADQETMIRAMLDPQPEDFKLAALGSSESEDWVSFITPISSENAFAVYMKRVCKDSYDGGAAFLTVLLPARTT